MSMDRSPIGHADHDAWSNLETQFRAITTSDVSSNLNELMKLQNRWAQPSWMDQAGSYTLENGVIKNGDRTDRRAGCSFIRKIRWHLRMENNVPMYRFITIWRTTVQSMQFAAAGGILRLTVQVLTNPLKNSYWDLWFCQDDKCRFFTVTSNDTHEHAHAYNQGLARNDLRLNSEPSR